MFTVPADTVSSMGRAAMWMECFAGDARIEGDDAETIADRFVAHAKESHDWPYPEEAIRNYARNYAEANVRPTGDTERLGDIGEVTVHPVTEDRLDDWVRFFDHDAFAGNPDWASCYCLEPHVPAIEENRERPWREVRAAMVDRLRTGGAFRVSRLRRREYCGVGQRLAPFRLRHVL